LGFLEVRGKFSANKNPRIGLGIARFQEEVNAEARVEMLKLICEIQRGFFARVFVVNGADDFGD